MLYFLLFAAILGTLKLSIAATISYFGAAAGLFIIAACIIIAYRCEPPAAAGARKIGDRPD